MKKISDISRNIFSITLFVSLIGGGVVGILYLVAIIIGGGSGEALAVATKSNILPWFIRTAAVAMFSGLVEIYTKGEHFLSMGNDKKDN